MQQVRVDQHRQHAEGLVVLDEAHAAHVGRQVVNLARPAAGLVAGVAQLQIGLDVFDVVEHLIPLVERLDVDTADSWWTLSRETGPRDGRR